MVSDELIGAHKTDPRLRRKSHTYGDEVEHLAGVLRQDHDGIWFLDYLEFMKSEADDNEQYGQFLLQHKRLIDTQRYDIAMLSESKEREGRIDKLRWLIRLHNDHLKLMDGQSFQQETGISRSYL